MTRSITIDADKIDELRARAGLEPDSNDGELFDGAQYDTPLPKLHGHRPDTIQLKFGGGPEIDLMDGQLVDYLKTLRLGQELDLHVTGTIAKVNWTHRNTGDDGEKVTHVVAVSVHSIELPEAP